MKLIARYREELLFFAVLFALVLFFYGSLLNLYISQDDFFHFRVALTDGSLKQFLELGTFRSFSERGGIYFYRPIFREYLYHIYYNLFGLSAAPFRITQFLIHFVNTVFVFILLRKLTSKAASFAGTLFFALVATNIGIISYLAGGIQVSGMMLFYLPGLYFFYKYLESSKVKFKIITFVLFVLALASHELALTFPFVLVGLCLYKFGLSKKIAIRALRDTFALFVISVLFVFLEVTVIGLPTGEAQYGFSLSPGKLINSYVWYFAWALGTPEMLLDFVGPGIRLNPNLMHYWGEYFKAIFPSLFLVLSIMLFSFKTSYKKKQFWLFVFIFIVGVLPVVFQPAHRQYYYLEVSLVGMAGIFGLTFEALKGKKLFAVLFVVVFLVLTKVSTDLSKTNYWAIQRANIAENLITDIKTKYPSLPKGAIVYFTNDPASPDLGLEWGKSAKQASVILSGSDALQLAYHDPSLQVYYEDFGEPPEDAQVFSIQAVIYR